MIYLLIVSLIWALSFGLIKNQLAGLDSTLVATVRVGLAALVFIPFLRFRGARSGALLKLTIVGAIQFGAMYLLYLHAYVFLKSFEVALFTTTTPLYVILFDATLRRKFVYLHWVAAFLAVAGTLIVVWHELTSPELLTGLMLVQLSNVCFAVGQLAYRRIRSGMTNAPDYTVFAWLYLGAVFISVLASLGSSNWSTFHPTLAQWGVLAYLGVLSSGICFFLWNRGATLVNAGTLATLNNLKAPLAIACSLIVFHEKPASFAEVQRLIFGGVLLIGAVFIAERWGEDRKALVSSEPS